MKPRRTWSVGDKTFNDYQAAQRYASHIRKSTFRQELTDAIVEHGLLEAAHVVEIVSFLLVNYDIKPKKGARRGQKSETASQE